MLYTDNITHNVYIMQPTVFDQSNLIANVTYPETQWFLSHGQRKVSKLVASVDEAISHTPAYEGHVLELLHGIKSCLALIAHPVIMQTLALQNTDHQTTLSQFPMGFAVIQNVKEAIERTQSALNDPSTLSIGIVQSLHAGIKPLAYAIMHTQDGLHGTFTDRAPRKNVLYAPDLASNYYQSLFAASDGKTDVQKSLDEKEITRMRQVVYGWIDNYNTHHPHANLRVAKDNLVTAFMQARQGQFAPLHLKGPRNKPLATLYYDETLRDFAIRIDTKKHLGTGSFKQATLVEKWYIDKTKKTKKPQMKRVLLAKIAIKSNDTTKQFHSVDTSKTPASKSDIIKYNQQRKLLAQYQDIVQAADSGFAKHYANAPYQGISLIDGKHRLTRISAEGIAPMFSTLRQYAAISKVNLDIKSGMPDQNNGNVLIDDQGTISIIDATLLDQGSSYEYIYHATTPLGFPTDKGHAKWRELHTHFLDDAQYQDACNTYFTRGIFQQTAQPHHQSYALLSGFYHAFCNDFDPKSQDIADAIKSQLAAYLQETLNQLGNDLYHSAHNLDAWNAYMNQTYAGAALERFFCTHVLQRTSMNDLHTAISEFEQRALTAITHHAKTLYRRSENGLHARRLAALARIQHQMRRRSKTPLMHVENTTTPPPPIANDQPPIFATTLQRTLAFPVKQTYRTTKPTQANSMKNLPSVTWSNKKDTPTISSPASKKPLSLFAARVWTVLPGGKQTKDR